MLRMEGGALRDVLSGFSRVLGEVGLDRQVGFQRRLDGLQGVPARSEGGGPRGVRI